MVQQRRQHEPMVLGHPPLEGQTQHGNLASHATTGQLSQLLGIVFATRHRRQHVAPGDAQDVTGHRTELDVGIFQSLVDAVHHRTLLANQLRPVASQISKLALRSIGYKARLQQSVLE